MSQALGCAGDWDGEAFSVIIRSDGNNENFNLSYEQIEFLTECAMRLSECNGEIGSAEFTRDFVFSYYTGKNWDKSYQKKVTFDDFAYNIVSYVDWAEETVKNDYRQLFGQEMPEFDLLKEYYAVTYDNGYYHVMGADFGDVEYRYSGLTSDGNDGYYVAFEVSGYDFGYIGQLIIQIVPSNSDIGFNIKSIEEQY